MEDHETKWLRQQIWGAAEKINFEHDSSLRKTVVFHRKLWKFLTNNPELKKEHWFEINPFFYKIHNNCFACHTASFGYDGECGNTCCFNWPIISYWSENPCLNSYYREWDRKYFDGSKWIEPPLDARAKYAALIWALPPKKWNYGKYSW